VVLALSDFWTAFVFLALWVPVALLWIATLVDVFRRADLGPAARVLWVIGIILFPWVGALLYIVLRPPGPMTLRGG
jgi:hypothetical protein